MPLALITGANGMVGAALTRQALAAGHRVRILTRPTSDLTLLRDVIGDVDHTLGDVTSPESLADAMRGVTVVFHVAGFISMDDKRDTARLRAVNVEGTAHVVNAALRQGVERLVHTSSIAALGAPESADTVRTETLEWRSTGATSFYGTSKHLAEMEVYRGIAEGLDAVMVNPSLIFGETLPGQGTRRIIDRVRAGRVAGYPTGSTNVVDVIDVADGHLRALEHGMAGERYILGSQNLSWHEVFATIADVFDARAPQRPVPPWLLRGAAASLGALATAFRFTPSLTPAMAEQASGQRIYSNQKALHELGCTFRPFRATLERLRDEGMGHGARGTG